MKPTDPFEALARHYADADATQVPDSLSAHRPASLRRRIPTEGAKWFSAAAAGVAIAVWLSLPGAPPPTSMRNLNHLNLDEQLVRSGLDPAEFRSVPDRRSRREGGKKWSV